MNIWVVIPAYNEENTILEIVNKIRLYLQNIIVVDDFSTDNTLEILKKLRVSTLNNSENIGYVRSLERGLNYAFCKGADFCITFDADGQHDPADLKEFKNIIEKKKPDFVVGRRKYKNRIMEEVIGFYTKLRYGISDPLCGLKAFKKNYFENYGCLEKTYTIGTEIIFKGLKQGAKYAEIEIKSNKRRGSARFGNTIKGNVLEVVTLLNILRV